MNENEHICPGKETHHRRKIEYIECDSGEKFWAIDVSDDYWVSHIKFCPYCNERLLPKNIARIEAVYFEEDD